MAQTNKPNPFTNDLVVVVHEKTLNKLLKAIGPITASDTFKVTVFTGKYTWLAQNMLIDLNPGKAVFKTDVNVKTGWIEYNTPVVGLVDVTYNQAKNQILIQVTQAEFELYTKIFGKRFHLKTVDLARYFKEPFVFEGPLNMETDFEVTLPDSTVKKLYTRPTKCDLTVEQNRIIVSAEVEFTEKPKLKQFLKN